VNVSLDPSLREKVLSGELMSFVCPDCGEQNYILYQLLYHDMEKHYMVYLTSKEVYESGALGSGDGGAKLIEFMGSYRLRVVFTLNELIEKILIFDEGLDDRAVELVKSAVHDFQETGDYGAGMLLFRGLVENDEDRVQLIMATYNDESQSYVAIPHALYENAAELLGESEKVDSEDSGLWLRVDHSYSVFGSA
jgi:hypothetical protein